MMMMMTTMPRVVVVVGVVDRARLSRRACSPAPRHHRARCVSRAHRRWRRLGRRRAAVSAFASSETDADDDADDDDATALRRAMRAASASASAGYSPGAGAGLSAEDQALAAYADLINTSPDVDGLDDDAIDALATRGARMDAGARARTREGSLADVKELFRALFGGAHIVRRDD